MNPSASAVGPLNGPAVIKTGGAARWLTATSHADIGTMYLLFALVMLFTGGGLALVVRAELFMPGLQFLQPDWYNNLITAHALIMMLGAVMPAAIGMAYRALPPMLGVRDMAFPRLSAFAFWLQPAAALVVVLSMIAPLLGAGPPTNTGWTLYPPLSLRVGLGMDLLIAAVHLFALSSILVSINILVTILERRAGTMPWSGIPIFAWAWVGAGLMLVTSMPVLAGTVTMLFLDRHFETSFFSAAGGGDPVLYQHLFWFFGHPEVYVLLLPSIGIMATVIPVYSRKPLSGYRIIVVAILAMTVLAMMVWAHHQYTAGISESATRFFMLTTGSISIPVSLILISLVLTMVGGRLTFETPMLLCMGSLVLFAIGGFTGVMLASVPLDMQYHDTYFVVAHFHFTLIPGALFGLYAGVFHWLPQWTGAAYSEKLGRLFFWVVAFGFSLTFLPLFLAGLAGMPRRIADYNPGYAGYNMASSIGAFIFGAANLLFLYIVVSCIRSGRRRSAHCAFPNTHGDKNAQPGAHRAI